MQPADMAVNGLLDFFVAIFIVWPFWAVSPSIELGSFFYGSENPMMWSVPVIAVAIAVSFRVFWEDYYYYYFFLSEADSH